MNHAAEATEFVNNDQRAHWHDRALWFVREKRDRVAHGVAEWELLREKASQIKAYTVANLADLLEQFKQRMGEMLAEFNDLPPADGFDRVYYPGQIEGLRRQQRAVEGIPIDPGLYEELEGLGIQYGVAFPG